MRISNISGDATKDNILRYYASFFLPVFAGGLIQQLYNVVDTIIVGRHLGENALAAVGGAGTLIVMAGGLGGGMMQGFGILIAQACGERNAKKIRKYVANSFYLCFVITGIIMAVFIIFNHQMLMGMNTIPELYADIKTYQMINFAGLPALFLFRLSSTICQSMGNSKTPMVFMTISSITNIVLSIVFVMVWDKGVAGVAYATIISQVVSAAGCILYLKAHYGILSFNADADQKKFDLGYIKKLLKMGIPMSLQPCIIVIGGLFIQTAMNSYSPAHIAASSAVGRISSIMMGAYISLGATISVFVAQNYGAKQYDRIKKGIKTGNILASCYSVLIIIFMPLVLRPMITLFLGDNLTEEVFYLSGQFFYAIVMLFPVLGVLEVYRSAIRGLGKSVVNMLSSVFEVLGKSIMVFVVGSYIGFDAIRFSNPVSWIFTLIPIIPCYIITMRKLTKESKDKT